MATSSLKFCMTCSGLDLALGAGAAGFDFSAGVVSHPESRSDPNGGSEPSSRRETQDWDSLPDFFFFFFKSQLAPVGLAHIL